MKSKQLDVYGIIRDYDWAEIYAGLPRKDAEELIIEALEAMGIPEDRWPRKLNNKEKK